MLSSVHKLKSNLLTRRMVMSIFETILKSATTFDYVIAVIGVLCIILGIAQLCTKKSIGVGKIDTYTRESVGKFAVVSSVIYILGGIVTAVSPFAVKYINMMNYGFKLPTALSSWILTAVIVLVLIVQLSILKKKQ